MKNLKLTFLTIILLLISTTLFSQNNGLYLENKLVNPTNEIKQTLQKRAFIWIKGQWKIENNKYVWQKGYWENKKIGYIFINGSWLKKSNGWTWIEGYWKKIDINKWMSVYS
tara:strand:+ start:350 stop:685 length:336 start_codon:yes stop_codon:yes gene_type:complete